MKHTPLFLYDLLVKFFGEQDWWPVDHVYHKNHGSDPCFEVIVGAILTQNTAWSNVEKALEQLKRHDMLSAHALAQTPDYELESLIQSSGYFNQKAARLKQVSTYLLDTYQGDLSRLFSKDLSATREELLSLKGIGPETADSILLYAGHLPIFVVDAYTKRLCKRIPLDVPSLSYNDVQKYFQQNIQQQIPLNRLTYIYQQFHALIVELAKQYCTTKPKCLICPLRTHCLFQQTL